MTNKIDNKLDLLVKIANEENSVIKDVKALYKVRIQKKIQKTIENSGLHKKLSVNYQEVIEDIEQETWIKLLRTLKNTDIEKNDWLMDTEFVEILKKVSRDCTLDYTQKRGKKRNLKVGEKEVTGFPREFTSLEKMTSDDPSLQPANTESSPEDFLIDANVEIEFFDNLESDTEKEIMSLLLKGNKRSEIVDELQITLYKYNKALNNIKTQAKKMMPLKQDTIE